MNTISSSDRTNMINAAINKRCHISVYIHKYIYIYAFLLGIYINMFMIPRPAPSMLSPTWIIYDISVEQSFKEKMHLEVWETHHVTMPYCQLTWPTRSWWLINLPTPPQRTHPRNKANHDQGLWTVSIYKADYETLISEGGVTVGWG